MLKACLIICLLLSACGKASGDDRHIEFLNAPDGTVCYVAVQNNEVKGVSCK